MEEFELSLQIIRDQELVEDKVILRTDPDEIAFEQRFKDIEIHEDQLTVTAKRGGPLWHCSLSDLKLGSVDHKQKWKKTISHPNRANSASYYPGVPLIGSDGGGEAFGIDRNDGKICQFQVPFVGMDRSLIEVLSITFEGFLVALGTSL